MAGVRYVGAGVLASAVSMDKAYMKVVLAGGRAAGAAGDRRSPPASGRRDPAAVPRPRGRARLPAVREAGARRLEHRHLQGARRLRARRRARGRTRHDPKVLVEVVGRGRARGRVRRAPGARRRRPRPACPPRSGSPATTSSTTSRRSTSPRRPPSSTCRPTCRTTYRDRAAGAGGARVRGGRLRGPGPGRLLRDARRVAGRQRDQHDARLHAAVDVPADVGGHRRRLPRRSSTG